MMPARLFRAALAAALGAFVAGSALAAGGATVECCLEGTVRRIEVVRDPVSGRRCEMRYGKPENGRPARVVWFSERDPDFCHGRADNLIATLARRGWVCNVMPRRNVATGSDRTASAGPAPAVPWPQ